MKSPSKTGGLALGWEACQNTFVVDKITNPALMEAQSFKLHDDGTISSKATGFCLRRRECKDGGVSLGHIYDLGECRPDVSLKMKVQKAQANSLDHMRDMGSLHHATDLEVCDLCGPYRLQNMCLGTSDCGGSYQGGPGWTKLASQYVGDAAVTGNSNYGDDEHGGASEESDVVGIDMSGIGPTEQTGGLCGSFATDAPTLSSFFYALKADDSR